MTIQLKNIDASYTLGREGTVWRAALYINGTRAGYAYNSGQGGQTIWNGINDKGTALIREAEKWCKKQPKYTSSILGDDNKPMKLPMNLDLYLDLEVSRHLEQKQLRKDVKKSIAFGVPDSGSWQLLTFKLPLTAILSNKLYLGVLAEKLKSDIFPLLKNGKVILNTNIPEAIQEKLNIKKDQIVQQKEGKQQKKPQKDPNDDLDNRQKRPRSQH